MEEKMEIIIFVLKYLAETVKSIAILIKTKGVYFCIFFGSMPILQ